MGEVSKATKPLVLVTAAGGKIGGMVCTQLLAAGWPVRAVVRRKDARSERLAKLGAQLAVADLSDFASMSAAAAGTKRAFFVPPIDASALQCAVVLAAVAREHKLEHIVGISQWLASTSHPSLMSRHHALADDLLSSLRPHGITYTCLNPGFFADLPYMQLLTYAALLGVFPWVGDTSSKNAPPSCHDIARVGVACLQDPAAHAGKTYRPTGPQLLSVKEMVAIMERVLGRKISIVPSSLWLLNKAALSENQGEYTVSQLGYYLHDHDMNAFAHNAPTTDVLDVTGTPAETFEATARRFAALPHNAPTLGNRLRAWCRFMIVPCGRGLDADTFIAARELPLASKPQYAMDNKEWKASHAAASR